MSIPSVLSSKGQFITQLAIDYMPAIVKSTLCRAWNENIELDAVDGGN